MMMWTKARCSKPAAHFPTIRTFSKRKDNLPPPSHSIPLTEEFPGTPKLNHISSLSSLERPITKITTLPNGLRVASEETYTQTSAVAVFVDCGTVYETPETEGISRLMERMAYKTTKTISQKDVVQELEEFGGQITSASSREVMLYTADVTRETLPRMIELLADTLINVTFEQHEIDEQKAVLKIELEEDIFSQPDQITQDLLHSCAFAGPLSLPTIPRVDVLTSISRDVLQQWHQTFFRPERMVLSVAGEQHDAIVELASKYFKFGSFPSSTPFQSQHIPSVWVGGEHRSKVELPKRHDPYWKPLSHLIVAFPGSSFTNPDLYATATLQSLLGGGGSFSAGGPGKGMYSRLYRNVLNGYGFVESANAFSLSYLDTGSFGIYASCDEDKSLDMLEVLLQELLKVAKKMNEEELLRAKNQLKSSIFSNLESRAILVDDIGRQVMVYGMRHSADYITQRIDSLTINDIQKALKKMLLSTPAIVSYAPDHGTLPKYEDIKNTIAKQLSSKWFF